MAVEVWRSTLAEAVAAALVLVSENLIAHGYGSKCQGAEYFRPERLQAERCRDGGELKHEPAAAVVAAAMDHSGYRQMTELPRRWSCTCREQLATASFEKLNHAELWGGV